MDSQRVIQKRVLRRLQEPTTKQQIRQWRKVHDEDLHNLYFSPRVIKLRKRCTHRRDKKYIQNFGRHALGEENICKTTCAWLGR